MKQTIKVADKPTLDAVKEAVESLSQEITDSGSGGIAPSNTVSFSATAGNGEVKLFIKEPSDTVIDGQTLCTIAGVKIMRKDTDYPNGLYFIVSYVDILNRTKLSREVGSIPRLVSIDKYNFIVNHLVENVDIIEIVLF